MIPPVMGKILIEKNILMKKIPHYIKRWIKWSNRIQYYSKTSAEPNFSSSVIINECELLRKEFV